MSTCGDHGGVTASGRPCRKRVEGGRCGQHNGGNRGGRRGIEITEEQAAQVEKLAAVLTQEQIADFLGISDRTLRKKLSEDEDLRAAYQKGRASAIAGVATKLLRSAREGNMTAMIFFLKTQAGWREASDIHGLFAARVEHSGEIQGADVHIYLPAKERGAVVPNARREVTLSGNGKR